MYKIEIKCTDPETVQAIQVEEPEYDGCTTTPALQNFFLFGSGGEAEGHMWLNWGGRLAPEEVANALIGLDNELGFGGAFSERVMTTLAKLGGFEAAITDDTAEKGGEQDD